MKRIIKNKSVLHRMIALVMSVVMILTLVAIDSHFSLSAEEPTPVTKVNLKVTSLFKGECEEDKEVLGLTSPGEFQFVSDAIEGFDFTNDVKYIEYTGGTPANKVNTPTDADGYKKLYTTEVFGADDIVKKYAFYKKKNNVNSEKYNLIGTVSVVIDNTAPDITSVVVDGNSKEFSQKTDYYVLNGMSSGKVTLKVWAEDVKPTDALEEANNNVTGIDRIVFMQGGGGEQTMQKSADGSYYYIEIGDYSQTYTFRAYDKAGNASTISEPYVFKAIFNQTTVKSVTLKKKSDTSVVLSDRYLKDGQYYNSSDDIVAYVELDLPKDGNDIIDVSAKICYKFIKNGNLDTSVPVHYTDFDSTTFEIPVTEGGIFNNEQKVKNNVLISVIDEFNNQSQWHNLDGKYVFVDNKAPTVVANSSNTGWTTNGNFPEIKIEAWNKYSYVETVRYSHNGFGTGDTNKVTKNISVYESGSDAPDFDVKSTISTKKGDKSSNSGTEISLPDGEHDIIVEAVSSTGVVGSATVTVKIDTTFPTITPSTTIHTTEIDGVEYYAMLNSSDTIEFTWDDTYSGVTPTDETIKARLVPIDEKNSTKYLKVNFVEGESNKAYVSVDDGVPTGLYKLEISAVDGAGNKTIINACDSDNLKHNIMVNNSVPSAEIVAEAKGLLTGEDSLIISNSSHISARKVEVTFTASGSYLTPEEITIKDNDNLLSIDSEDYDISGKPDGERTISYTYTITGIAMQGKHNLTLSVKNRGSQEDSSDEAGEENFEFVYDIEGPKFKITEKPKSYNNTDATVKFYATDATDDVKTIHIKGKRKVYSLNEKGERIITENKDVEEKLAKDNTQFTFKDEGYYELDLWAEDKAGNISEKINIKFVIDTERPIMTYSEQTVEPSALYLRKQLVKITIRDAYGISAKDVELVLNYLSFDKEDVGNTKISLEQKNSYTVVATVKLAQRKGKASRYKIGVSGSDKAGNSISKANSETLSDRYYYIDSTEPSIMIDPVPEDKNDGYYKKNVSFGVSVIEQFDNGMIPTFKKDHKLVITDNKGTGKTKTYSFNTNDYTCYPTYTEEGEYELSIEVTDACGNIMTTDTYFFIDKTKPEVALGSVNAINNSAVSVPMTLTDNMKGAKYKVHVVRTDASGNVVFEGVQENGVWDGTDFSKSLSFGDDGDYLVTVTAEDKVGNKSEEASVKFRIDRTAPVISISGVQDKQATTCTATISIDEEFSFTFEGRSLPNDAISVTITKKTDGSSAANVATMNTTNFSVGNPHSASFNATEDGEYTITANAKDLAGNVAASVTKTFKVDSKAPIVKVTAYDKDSNAVSSYDAVGSKDNEEANYVDMTLSVEESFFTTNNVKIVVKKDGSDVSSAYFTNYGNTSTISTGSQRFTEDGAYNITITAQDEIGNKAEDFNMVFTVDNTAPEIKATNKLEKLLTKAEGEDGNLLLNAEDFADILDKGYDALWNISDTSVFNVDAKLDGVDFVDFSDLADGYHKLVATVTDELGHVTVNEFEFTYDGTAPRIIITGVEDGETLREPFTMTIGLENEADIISSIVINGNTIDPSLYQANNKYEMQVEEYATYTIEVEATDKAGNVATTFNKDTGKPFTFKLSEKLSPVMLIIIILAVILLLALLIFIIIAGKRKKRNAA